MKPDRLIRVNELLKREIGAYLARVIALERDGFDRSILTVTHVITSSDLHSARVLVSIFGHEKERAAILGRLERHRPGLQRQIGDAIGLKYTPRLLFELDTSLAEGDRMIHLLDEIEKKTETPAPPGDGKDS